MLTPEAFQAVVGRLCDAAVRFVVEPHLARIGTPGEQLIFLVDHGCGNVVEVKGMDAPKVFTKETGHVCPTPHGGR